MYVSVVAVGYAKRVNQYFMYLCVWVSLVPQSPDPFVAGRLSIGDYNFQSISALRPKGVSLYGLLYGVLPPATGMVKSKANKQKSLKSKVCHWSFGPENFGPWTNFSLKSLVPPDQKFGLPLKILVLIMFLFP